MKERLPSPLWGVLGSCWETGTPTEMPQYKCAPAQKTVLRANHNGIPTANSGPVMSETVGILTILSSTGTFKKDRPGF